MEKEREPSHMDFPPAIYSLHSDGVLRKKGGLHEIREAQKKASGSAKWVRVYDKGVPGVSVGYNRPGLLQATKAMMKEACGAGRQPHSRTFGEDPPPQKSGQETFAQTADHIFGKPSGPEPERKFTQTPAELLNKSTEVGLSGTERRKALERALETRRILMETEALIEGRQRFAERTAQIEMETEEARKGKMHVQMYEREARRHHLKSRALNRERLQIMSRQSTRSPPSRRSRVASELYGSASRSFSATDDLADSIDNQYPPSEPPPPDSESERGASRAGEREAPFMPNPLRQHWVAPDELLASSFVSSPGHGRHPKRHKDSNDPLEAIERLARAHGRVSDAAHSLIKNGTMTAAGLHTEIVPVFQTDATVREKRRVVTGGAADRLNYSDGSMMVLLPPKVINADPSRTSKPLPLRDGTPSGIAQRTQPKSRPATVASGAFTHALSSPEPGGGATSPWEVSRLSEFHRRGEGRSSPVDLSFTTSLDDHDWEASVRKRTEVREGHEKALKRPDLEALSEFYAIQKFKKEQEGVAKVQQTVQVHRQYERRKLEERHARTQVLQSKAGQRLSALSYAGGSALRPSLRSPPWRGSWTPESGVRGSLTHNAPGTPAFSLNDDYELSG